jgi:tetratricopeptide (TPR) repeat protein
MPCLDENTVIALAEGALEDASRATVDAHLDTCPDCRGLVAGMVRAFGGARRTRQERPRRPAPGQPEAGAPGGSAVLTAGARLGRYVLLHRLGEGGMGLVWAAYDPGLNRNVALKQVREESGEPLEIARARLKREGQAMARLSHPNVVPIFDLFEEDGAFFVAMEWVEGITLRQWLEEAPRPWREVVARFVEAGRGLAAAHAAGLVHRDFKPANVFLGKNGTVRVGDFGLARELDATASTGFEGDLPAARGLPRLTERGAVAGTPAYMAPEQRAGKRDLRSDQFSFCAALFEALEGHLPQEPPPADRPRRQQAPRRIMRALARGLSNAPEDRFPSLDALLDALTREPWRGWRVPAVAGGVLAVAVGGLWLQHSVAQASRRALCEETVAQLTPGWRSSEGAPAQITAALGTERWRRTEAVLDAYQQASRTLLTQACHTVSLATGSELLGPGTAFARQAACVTTGQRRLQALAKALDAGDRGIAPSVLVAADALPPLAGCRDLPALARVALPAAGQTPQRDRLEMEIAQAETSVLLGKAAQWDPTTLVEKARAVGDRTLEVRALLLPDHGGPPEDARLYQAAWAAQAAHEDRLAVRAWTTLGDQLTGEGHLEEATRALHQARAAQEGLGAAPRIVAGLEAAEGRLALRQRRFASAIESLKAARVKLEEEGGALSPSLPPVLTPLAEALEATRRADEAMEARRRAVAIGASTLGPEDPALLAALDPLIDAELRARRWTEALGDARHALALYRAGAEGSTKPGLSRALYRVGLSLAHLGRSAEAREVLGEARAALVPGDSLRSAIQLALEDLPSPGR